MSGGPASSAADDELGVLMASIEQTYLIIVMSVTKLRNILRNTQSGPAQVQGDIQESCRWDIVISYRLTGGSALLYNDLQRH